MTFTYWAVLEKGVGARPVKRSGMVETSLIGLLPCDEATEEMVVGVTAKPVIDEVFVPVFGPPSVQRRSDEAITAARVRFERTSPPDPLAVLVEALAERGIVLTAADLDAAAGRMQAARKGDAQVTR